MLNKVVMRPIGLNYTHHKYCQASTHNCAVNEQLVMWRQIDDFALCSDTTGLLHQYDVHCMSVGSATAIRTELHLRPGRPLLQASIGISRRREYAVGTYNRAQKGSSQSIVYDDTHDPIVCAITSGCDGRAEEEQL